MSYEYDRNCFGKLLIPPFRKYIHYRVYLLPIFVKKIKTQIFPNIKHLENGRNFESVSMLWKTGFSLWTAFWGLVSHLRFVMLWFYVRWTALIWSNLFKTLNAVILFLEKFLEPFEVKMFDKHWWKHRNFESLNWICVFISFWRTCWVQVYLIFLRKMW